MNLADTVALKTVLRSFGHTAGLHAGTIPIPGVRLDFVAVSPFISAYRRMVRELEFDLCELAPTTYFIARAHGAPFTALPILLTRRFHHRGLLVHPDAGIKTPADLKGKRVGVRAYSVTTGVWTRGILANEFGLDSADVTWVVDDEEHVTQLKLPPNVIHVPDGRSLAAMMAAGELAAAFAGNAGIGREGPPRPGWEAQAPPATDDYAELLSDWPRLEAEWHRRTAIYPFHSVVVIKDAILKSHPWIAKSLYDAFVAAKAQWLPDFKSGRANSAEDKICREMVPLVGEDPLPYGIAPNRKSMETLVQYSLQQGLIPRRLAVDELFVDPVAR
jgi:4,5-dihydroxyphthalate decarboxylase